MLRKYHNINKKRGLGMGPSHASSLTEMSEKIDPTDTKNSYGWQNTNLNFHSQVTYLFTQQYRKLKSLFLFLLLSPKFYRQSSVKIESPITHLKQGL